jgi:hypothetical protein
VPGGPVVAGRGRGQVAGQVRVAQANPFQFRRAGDVRICRCE